MKNNNTFLISTFNNKLTPTFNNNFDFFKLIFKYYAKNFKGIRKFSTSKKNIASLYSVNSPMYKILTNILESKSLNEQTQLNLEKLLRDQYVVKLLDKKKLEENMKINFNKINGSLTRDLIIGKDLFVKLINNFKKTTVHTTKNSEIIKIILNVSED
jgi:hypothetical protein